MIQDENNIIIYQLVVLSGGNFSQCGGNNTDNFLIEDITYKYWK